MSIKIKVTKKQQRIINDILRELNQRQHQYVEENSRLFHGSSLLPFHFALNFNIAESGFTSVWATRVLCYRIDPYVPSIEAFIALGTP